MCAHIYQGSKDDRKMGTQVATFRWLGKQTAALYAPQDTAQHITSHPPYCITQCNAILCTTVEHSNNLPIASNPPHPCPIPSPVSILSPPPSLSPTHIAIVPPGFRILCASLSTALAASSGSSCNTRHMLTNPTDPEGKVIG